MVSAPETGSAALDTEDAAPDTETQELVRCPHLGLTWDRELTGVNPSHDHRCAASRAAVDLDYQASTCMTAAYVDCPLYQNPPVKPEPVKSSAPVRPEKPRNPNAIPGFIWSLPLLGFATGFLLSMF